MFIVFISGATIGFALGIVFHYWWIQPDIKELKLHIEKTENSLDLASSYILKSINTTGTRTTIRKIEIKKPEK